MHTGILSGGEFSAKEKLRDVVADGGEFNIICQNALTSSAISLKYEKTLSILLLHPSQAVLIASVIIFFITTKHYSKHVAVTVKFVK